MKQWLWAPASAILAALGFLGGYSDAVALGVLPVFWTALWILVAFYGLVSVLAAIQLILWAWRAARRFVAKAGRYDHLEAEIGKLRTAAAMQTARAEDAEAKIESWELDTLREGRRRALAELAAQDTPVTFTDVRVAEVDGQLLIAATAGGYKPSIDARFILQSATFHKVAAVLEAVRLLEDRTVVFRVSSVVSEKYRAELHALAGELGAALPGVEIVPRNSDLGEEPLWPEK